MIVIDALLFATAAAAQPAPSCPGDCNLDGSVTIEELLRGVNGFLDGVVPSGCEELDDDRDGAVQVNELVRAVLEALDGCLLEGDAAGEAAAQAALGIVDSFQVLDIGGVAAGSSGGGTGGGGGVVGVEPLGGTRGLVVDPQPCNAGGAIAETCTVSRGRSLLTVVYTECATTTTGMAATVIDGSVVRSVNDSAYCETRVIADGREANEELSDFRLVLLQAGQLAFEFTGSFTRRFLPNGTSCAGRASVETIAGTLAFRCAAGLDSIACPAEGKHVALVVRDLTLVRAGSGEPAECTRTRTLLGRVESRDLISGQAFDVVHRELLVREELRSGLDIRTAVDGGLALDCLGEITLGTEVPLERPGDAHCPDVGFLTVRLADGLERGIRYRRGAVSLDLDGDGLLDRDFASCEDPALAQCR